MTSFTRLKRLQFFKLLAALSVACAASAAQSQNAGMTSTNPLQVVHLQASATQELAQDTLLIALSATRDGADAASVQAALKQVLDAALAVAKAQASAQAMEVRTGGFSLYPRYDRQGKINGWQGSAELVLEGKDFARISATAGKVQGMVIQNVLFSLSRSARQKVEAEVQADAIARFRTQAESVAKQFGFGGYTLKEVHVSAADQGQRPQPRMMAMEMKSAAADSAVPVEAGKSTVMVTVSGSVVLK